MFFTNDTKVIQKFSLRLCSLVKAEGFYERASFLQANQAITSSKCSMKYRDLK